MDSKDKQTWGLNHLKSFTYITILDSLTMSMSESKKKNLSPKLHQDLPTSLGSQHLPSNDAKPLRGGPWQLRPHRLTVEATRLCHGGPLHGIGTGLQLVGGIGSQKNGHFHDLKTAVGVGVMECHGSSIDFRCFGFG